MAKLYGLDSAKDFAANLQISLPTTFSRTAGQPVDYTQIWYPAYVNDLWEVVDSTADGATYKSGYERACNYATTVAAYVGQELAVIDVSYAEDGTTITGTSVKFYGIQDANGTLKELGAIPVGDNTTIKVDATGKISVITGKVESSNSGLVTGGQVQAAITDATKDIASNETLRQLRETVEADLKTGLIGLAVNGGYREDTVIFSGNYTDIGNKATLPKSTHIINKPELYTFKLYKENAAEPFITRTGTPGMAGSINEIWFAKDADSGEAIYIAGSIPTSDEIKQPCLCYVCNLSHNLSQASFNKLFGVNESLSDEEYNGLRYEITGPVIYHNHVEFGAQENKIEVIKVNGAAQQITDKTVNIKVPEYSIVKAANSGDYAAVYQLTKDGTNIGAAINIPKDLVVESGSVETVTEANKPYEGAKVDDKYIKLKIANQQDPLYIAVKDLVDVYKAQGNAAQVQLEISGTNEISATLVDGAITTDKLNSEVGVFVSTLIDQTVTGNDTVKTLLCTLDTPANCYEDPETHETVYKDEQLVSIQIPINNNFTVDTNYEIVIGRDASMRDPIDFTYDQTTGAFTANDASLGLSLSVKENTATITLENTTDGKLWGFFATPNKDSEYSDTKIYIYAVNTQLGIEKGAQVNTIETIKVNGTALEIENKSVDITIPSVGDGTFTLTSSSSFINAEGSMSANQSSNSTGYIDLSDTAKELLLGAVQLVDLDNYITGADQFVDFYVLDYPVYKTDGVIENDVQVYKGQPYEHYEPLTGAGLDIKPGLYYQITVKSVDGTNSTIESTQVKATTDSSGNGKIELPASANFAGKLSVVISNGWVDIYPPYSATATHTDYVNATITIAKPLDLQIQPGAEVNKINGVSGNFNITSGRELQLTSINETTKVLTKDPNDEEVSLLDFINNQITSVKHEHQVADIVGLKEYLLSDNGYTVGSTIYEDIATNRFSEDHFSYSEGSGYYDCTSPIDMDVPKLFKSNTSYCLQVGGKCYYGQTTLLSNATYFYLDEFASDSNSNEAIFVIDCYTENNNIVFNSDGSWFGTNRISLGLSNHRPITQDDYNNVVNQAIILTELLPNLNLATKTVATVDELGLVKATAPEYDNDGNITNTAAIVNKVNVGTDGTMTVNAISVDKLENKDGYTLVLFGGNAR